MKSAFLYCFKMDKTKQNWSKYIESGTELTKSDVHDCVELLSYLLEDFDQIVGQNDFNSIFQWLKLFPNLSYETASSVHGKQKNGQNEKKNEITESSTYKKAEKSNLNVTNQNDNKIIVQEADSIQNFTPSNNVFGTNKLTAVISPMKNETRTTSEKSFSLRSTNPISYNSISHTDSDIDDDNDNDDPIYDPSQENSRKNAKNQTSKTVKFSVGKMNKPAKLNPAPLIQKNVRKSADIIILSPKAPVKLPDKNNPRSVPNLNRPYYSFMDMIRKHLSSKGQPKKLPLANMKTSTPIEQRAGKNFPIIFKKRLPYVNIRKIKTPLTTTVKKITKKTNDSNKIVVLSPKASTSKFFAATSGEKYVPLRISSKLRTDYIERADIVPLLPNKSKEPLKLGEKRSTDMAASHSIDAKKIKIIDLDCNETNVHDFINFDEQNNLNDVVNQNRCPENDSKKIEIISVQTIPTANMEVYNNNLILKDFLNNLTTQTPHQNDKESSHISQPIIENNLSGLSTLRQSNSTDIAQRDSQLLPYDDDQINETNEQNKLPSKNSNLLKPINYGNNNSNTDKKNQSATSNLLENFKNSEAALSKIYENFKLDVIRQKQQPIIEKFQTDKNSLQIKLKNKYNSWLSDGLKNASSGSKECTRRNSTIDPYLLLEQNNLLGTIKEVEKRTIKYMDNLSEQMAIFNAKKETTENLLRATDQEIPNDCRQLQTKLINERLMEMSNTIRNVIESFKAI